jgi:flagellar M-ring protein FliF
VESSVPQSDAPAARTPTRLPNRLIALVFVVIFGALAFAYWFFLSGSFSPAFTGLRPSEASAVIGQLTAKTIPYRLQDGGTTILVPTDQVDATRVAIAGSDVPMKGGVGFELFNKSDMGLTDFAQRINYQRALQGELERSIMMLDGVEMARVHLAMPERTLFRSDRNSAKAAVELVGKGGQRFDEARVAGIQRLVAFAVPDLMSNDVVILDEDGKLLSSTPAAAEAPLTPEAEEQRAVSSYYRARIRAAIGQAVPGVKFEVTVLVDPGATMAQATGTAAGSTTDATYPSDTPKPNVQTRRTFGLRITVASPTPINEEDRTMAQSALAAAVGFDERLGDTVSFEVGLVGTSPPPAAAAQSIRSGTDPVTDAAPLNNPLTMPTWLYVVLGTAALAAVIAVVTRSRRTPDRLTDAERSAMVARLRARLAEGQEAHG